MFEYVRTHQRLMQFILLLFIVPSFALVGISSYMGNGNEDILAKVNGEKISQQEFDNVMRVQIDQLRERFGAQFDESMFNNVMVKESVLNRLITQRVLDAEAKKEHLNVPDSVLQQAILAIPGLTLPDGSFDSQGYKNALAAQGMTPVMYEANLRQDLVRQQLITAVQASAFAPQTVVAQISQITNQEREIQSLNFNVADFVKQVNITDAMLKDYYDKHGTQFAIPEMADIQYVVLSMDAIAAKTAVSDEDIKAYYDQNLKQFGVDEQRRASHILIKVDKAASAADKAAAKTKAEEVLAMVRKQPGEFAKLAKQYSQDEGSAAQGGDLNFFGRGMMVKPFEEVAFQLKQGEISGLVESDFGYHIIELTAIKPAVVKPLAEVKEQISADIKKQKAGKQFSEMAETFTNTVYEQSDSLKPAADKLNLTIQTVDKLTRNPGNPAAMTNPVLSNPKLLKALFSDDAIKNKRNTEAVEVAPNTLVAARIVDYKPTSKRPFDEVKESVTMLVKVVQAEALAKKSGEEKLASLLTDPQSAGGFGNSKLISRLHPEGIAPQAFETIMKANVSKLPAFVGVDLPGQSYTIYRIGKVQQATPDPARTAELTQQINDVFASTDLYEFIETLKQKAKVEVLKPFATTAAQAG